MKAEGTSGRELDICAALTILEGNPPRFNSKLTRYIQNIVTVDIFKKISLELKRGLAAFYKHL